MILGLAPIFIAAVAGAVLMVLTRCLSMDEAPRMSLASGNRQLVDTLD